ncbi:hypothetical protein Ddye_009621 [Dipteronia dyeriana]|uniref:GPI ethanolamine phosphate transferase 2 C-terminal domain-containing protein n=1 Tax=Dipteronia dyeriana TaxID=168575 RepID=A0AAD9XBR7_9ROSI|nr:hypothetical protein Ddye_009621 [Dipteronia dyeriana]
MSCSCTKWFLLTLAGVTLQLIGLSLFVFGFFPVKPALSGFSGPESYNAPACDDLVRNRNPSEISRPPDQLRSLYQELSGLPPSFDRLILMVVDGLPAEFVLGKDGMPPRKVFVEAMPYTQSLLASGKAIGYHAKAAPPTVTMPRLKAMVSGAIGGFLDVAFNFNTQAFLDDNLLGQLFSIGWKMVMLGDETWLKLFPGLFTRHDGVSSFFVKDTVEVDKNVSRHLGNELRRDDWNLLILHYLGLDHVGHVGGRNSVLMAPKLAEMDEIVKMIHTSTILTQENDQEHTLLMVVSDHGMTEHGNHGGSSFEETDSLALFIGLRNHVSDYASATQNTVHQVDIAPTLALLLGVPIPKNSVGVMISETFDLLKDDQLRALELNSWQLLRLLQAQLSELSCGNIPCNGVGDTQKSGTSDCNGSIEKMLCCLYVNAAVLHSSWKSKRVAESNSWEDYSIAVAAYNKFLKTASEWLSSRATDKPVGLLAFGVAALLLSCLILSSLVLYMCREVYLVEKLRLSYPNDMCRWLLDEIFVIGVILILVISMTSSSMVEEEHYIWHFMTSTLFLLLLRKTAQLLPAGSILSEEQSRKCRFQICSILVLVICGRIMRSWHQGGVNWTNLPDISKWLEQAGSDHVKTFQLVSGCLVICFGLYSLSLLESKQITIVVVGFSFSLSGLLLLLHILKFQDYKLASSSYGATLLAQIIYAVLATTTVGSFVTLPWLMPIRISNMDSNNDINSSSPVPSDVQYKSPWLELRDSLYVIGWAYILCWCVLQLLLQQPINSMPILLLLVEIMASMLYFFFEGPHCTEWVEVSALYFLGMAGHFALGNSNTLATIDVAGAFIGISNHSTVLSGILMLIITYASPMLVLISMVVYMSVNSYHSIPQKTDSGHLLKRMLGFPCLVPLGLNSILLTAYTIVLLLMRNHLFVWSVFSPK